MAEEVKRRRGTAAEHAVFIGAAGEITVNTTNNTLHVHDGTTVGGFEIARADLANVGALNLEDAEIDNLTVTDNTLLNYLSISDPTLTIGGNVANVIDDNKDRGMEFRWHTGSVARLGFFGFDDSSGKFTFIPNAANTADVFSGTAGDVVFGAGSFSGVITATGGNSTEWNTAYDYSLTDGLLLRQRTDIGNAIDLDTYTSTGLYHQNSTAQAAAGTNYPIPQAGMLTVSADGSMVYQTYQGYSTNSTYERKSYNGAWSGWTKYTRESAAGYVSVGTLTLGAGQIIDSSGAISFGNENLTTTGTLTATGGNSTNWNTAYGWGNHASASYATQSYVGTQISNLVDSSPAALNTLNELAAALGDDPNFATTVTNSIATKMPLAGGTLTGAVTISSNTDQMISLNSLDSNAVYVAFQRGGVRKAYFGLSSSGSPLVLANEISDGDIQFLGNDGGVSITALNLDMSNAGKAIFNAGATFGSGIDVTGTVTATGGNSTNWNTAYGWGDHSSAGYTGYGDTQVNGDTFWDISNLYRTTAEIRAALNTASTNIVAVDDSTAPEGGCFQVTDAVQIQANEYWKVDENATYHFEVWMKYISGTDTTSGFYAGWSGYDASKTYFGNTNRYWAAAYEEIDADTQNDGLWHKVVGRIGAGQHTSGIQYAKPLMLLNYAGSADTVIRYCGLKMYRADEKLVSSIKQISTSAYNGSVDTHVNTILSAAGDLTVNNITISSATTSNLRLSNTDTVLTENQITGQVEFYQSDISSDPDGIGITGKIGMRSVPNLGSSYFGMVADMDFYVSGQAVGYASDNATLKAMTIQASSGNVGIGTTAPTCQLDIGGTGAMKFPSGTTAQRPASPTNGMTRYNSQTNAVETYQGSLGWVELSNNFSATGGTESTYSSGGVNYKVHTFTSSGTFTAKSSGTVEYLVVAGGGGGGGDTGGGAGAGGYRSSVSGESSGGGTSAESALAINSGNYTVTVGGGGSGSSNTPNGNVPRGSNGQNSVFGSITSTGGGGGGAGQGRGGGTGDGLSGGSGGGGGGAYPSNGSQGSGGSGTSGQGYAGSAGNSVASPERGGGGGGAGGAGTIESDGGGDGGNGVSSSITGSSVTRGGGGGGGAYLSASGIGIGGSGGGGNGSTKNVNDTAQSGSANTGGGGGSATEAATGTGGNGGSGIVIIRYVV